MAENSKRKGRKSWSSPELVRLTADLTAVAGNSFPPGDNGVTNGKQATPVS